MSEKFFAYLNIDDPLVAWEVAIGRLRSVGVPGPDNHPNFVSLFLSSKLRDSFALDRPRWLKRELVLEKARAARHPQAVSRLAGVYMFTSMEDALRALAEWRIPGWKREYISEVQFFANQLTIADSDWITEDLFSPDTGWMDSYWSGVAKRKKPLLEALGIGVGQIQNRALREQAYQAAIRNWPGATNLLQRASYGFAEAHMEAVAQIRAHIGASDNKLILSHVIYMEDFTRPQDRLQEVIFAAAARGDFPTALPPDDQYVPDLREKNWRSQCQRCSNC
ncbi:hypothetical protein [Variovorax sp. YR566]|uniref:hypothetical protein n=1 Tax=Variovorax sp. YR566 TaxID=3450237 RepID=UPI003F7D24C8